MQAARKALKVQGFQAVGGKSAKGKSLMLIIIFFLTGAGAGANLILEVIIHYRYRTRFNTLFKVFIMIDLASSTLFSLYLIPFPPANIYHRIFFQARLC